MPEPAAVLGRNRPRTAAPIEVRSVPTGRGRRRLLERDLSPVGRSVVRLAAWRLGQRHRALSWVRHRAPWWVRDPALPRRQPVRWSLAVGWWPRWSRRLMAWRRPGRPFRRRAGRWDRERRALLRRGVQPPRRGALPALGRPTGAGAHPSGGPRTGRWLPGRAVVAAPRRRWAGPAARPGPRGCRRATRRGRRGGPGRGSGVRAWRHRSRGCRFPARRRPGRVGPRSLDRSGGPAISRSRHRPRRGCPGRAPPLTPTPDVGRRPGTRWAPSGRHPAPGRWRRRDGWIRSSLRRPGAPPPLMRRAAPPPLTPRGSPPPGRDPGPRRSEHAGREPRGRSSPGARARRSRTGAGRPSSDGGRGRRRDRRSGRAPGPGGP